MSSLPSFCRDICSLLDAPVTWAFHRNQLSRLREKPQKSPMADVLYGLQTVPEERAEKHSAVLRPAAAADDACAELGRWAGRG